MAFTPTVLVLLQHLSAHPGGMSREELCQLVLHSPAELVDCALDKLLELGVAVRRTPDSFGEARGDLVVPLAPLPALAEKMKLLARRINRQEERRDQAYDLVKMLFRGP